MKRSSIVLILLFASQFSAAAVTLRFQASGIITHQGAAGASPVLTVGDSWAVDFVFSQVGQVIGSPPSQPLYLFGADGHVALNDFEVAISPVNNNDTVTIRPFAQIQSTINLTVRFSEQNFIGSTVLQNLDFKLFGSVDSVSGGVFSDLKNYTIPNGADTTNWFSAGVSPNGQAISGDIRTLSISSIPIPAGAWLFGSGLIGLLGIRRIVQ